MPLVGYWPLYEDSGSTAHDVRGNNDGTTNGGVTQGVTGILGSTAYDFDGADDEVEVPHDSSISLSGDFTINIWVKVQDTSSSRVFWLDKRVSGNSDGGTNYYISGPAFDSGTNLRFHVGNDDWRNIPIDTANIKGTWSMITFVFKDSNQFEAYLNGTVKSTKSTTASPNTNSGTLLIGDQGNNELQFEGKQAEIRIYDHALTAAEVQYLYSVTKQGNWVSTTKSL